MKFTIGFKTPDAIEYALDEYRDYSDESEDGDGMPLSEEQREEAKEKLEKWIRYGEIVTIDFDLDKMTAKVVSIK